MYSFLISLAVLILGYVIYGAYIERMIKPDANRATVAMTKADGVDFVPLPSWKIFMIQFLNIAGLGPIFGAVMGAKFGVASYFWIVLGTIFAGAVHDYIAGMISLRNDGESLPESIGRYLGMSAQQVMRFFIVILLILVSAVFVAGPAGLLAKLTAGGNPLFDVNFWVIIIFIYYIIATMLPIDKIIGRIYPLFSVALLFMEIGILSMLIFSKGWTLPEFTDPISYAPHPAGIPIFPMMFISIACGAISGFHASQSPMMARCMKNEKLGRPIFYGAMIVEGIEALIWAAAATYFFHENGFAESNAAVVVDTITRSWLGTFGAVLAMLGVVFAPITSGDTALRSARLIVADIFKFEQKSIKSRLIISLPLLLLTVGFLIYSLRDVDGFNIIWRYFAWANQVLATVTLWMISVYLVKEKKNYFVALIPALFMTAVVTCYILVAGEGLALPELYGYIVAGVAMAACLVKFLMWKSKLSTTEK
ncbi:MAG: carbon starvation CstA family protein [Rikenellaceae bacterium]